MVALSTAVNLLLLGVILVAHTAIAAVLTRFFRIRLRTQWGSVLYAVVLIPFVLFVSTLLVSGVLKIGVDLGSPAAALGVMVGMPMALGFTIDVLYVPPPDEVELPDTRQ